MKYTKFQIKNYKGVVDTKIDLSFLPNGKIFPLVGLNESGKTTILEAINVFQNRIINENAHEMIHKSKKGAFTGCVEISADLQLDDTDNQLIKDFLLIKEYKINNILDKVNITRKYTFVDSKLEEKGFASSWTISLDVKKKNEKNYKDLYDKDRPIWKELIRYIEEKMMPKILYFENFLFDFPEKIYLEKTPNYSDANSNSQEEYRNILQDILSSISEKKYKLSEHIINRIKNPSQQNEESLEQVINDMEKILNKTIILAWQEIFPHATEKKVEIKKGNDPTGHYLQFKINEGSSSFFINERSLGFRWFLSFLLFTEFRKARDEENGEYLFLFDEPANNLHQKSQQKLLEIFERLTNKSKIVYSTHSHHLLSPKFLLTAFVVKDNGRDASTNDLDNYSQDINAKLYRNFVSDDSGQQSHFQPILDCLEYIKNPFELSSNIVFFEGKYDYYTFKLLEKKFFPDESYNFSFYPGAGVEKYENIFREYLGNNRKFIAIFDADGEMTKREKKGKYSQKKYIDEISQELEKNIFTLKDVSVDFDRFTTEDLFDDFDKLSIQQKTFPSSTTYNKNEFNMSIQELFINENNFELSDVTKDRFKKIFDFIKQKFADLN